MDLDQTHADSSVRGLVAALLACALTTAVIAVPYWTADYAAVRDDGIFSALFLVELALLLGTFTAGSVSETPLWLVLALMLCCLPIVVMGRVVLDTAVDPTSHGLWPLEVVLSEILTLPALLLGLGLAWLARRLTGGRPSSPARPD
jgi:hypothetical protein